MDDETMIITALSSLSPLHLSDLTASLLSATDRHRRRIATVLSSPILFSTTLRHLHYLSLPHKSLLIARHLLSSLHLLTRHFPPAAAAATPQISHRDLDAVLILLLLCDLRHRDPQSLRGPHSEWRQALVHHFLSQTLTLSGAGNGLSPHVEAVARCWKFVGAARLSGEKSAAEVAASPAAVVALPSVEVRGGGGGSSPPECVICREEMVEGRDVCEFPCEHLFHWMCILPWLRKRNTCPCCRFALPTDDVYGEIQRLWSVLVKMSGSNSDGECR